MTPVNEYEIELTFTRDGKQESMTSTQWAYSVMEAMYQASFQVSNNGSAADLKVVRAGPPQRLIEVASRELAAHIATAVLRLGKT